MIKPKNKTCIECGRTDQPWFSKKRCKNCASKSYKKPAKTYKKQSKGDINLSSFFDYHIQEITKHPYCENCGNKITNPYQWSVAHILPKKKYKEVADDKNNAVYLCVWDNNCHNEFDTIQNSTEVYKMKVFEKVYEKY